VKNLLILTCLLGACTESLATDVSTQADTCTSGSTGEIMRCDGFESQSDADAYCNLVCGWGVGAFCWHLNYNDAYHGLCEDGISPIVSQTVAIAPQPPVK
jgi:hypothetical protein